MTSHDRSVPAAPTRRAPFLRPLATLGIALLLALPAVGQEPTEPETTGEAQQDGMDATTTTDPPPPEPGQIAERGLGVNEIVERHLAARLSEDPVRSIVAQGQLVFMGLQLPVEISIERPRSARVEADMAGTPLILAFDGEDGWTVSPMQGIPEPETLDEDAEEAVALFADFLWGLLDSARESGTEISLRGIETVGTDETYALELAVEPPRTIYIGGEDFLERRLQLETVFMGRLQKIDALLGDYRDVEGLMVPHDIQLLSGGAPLAQVLLREVATNAELAPDLFVQPPPPPTPVEQQPVDEPAEADDPPVASQVG